MPRPKQLDAAELERVFGAFHLGEERRFHTALIDALQVHPNVSADNVLRFNGAEFMVLPNYFAPDPYAPENVFFEPPLLNCWTLDELVRTLSPELHDEEQDNNGLGMPGLLGEEDSDDEEQGELNSRSMREAKDFYYHMRTFEGWHSSNVNQLDKIAVRMAAILAVRAFMLWGAGGHEAATLSITTELNVSTPDDFQAMLQKFKEFYKEPPPMHDVVGAYEDFPRTWWYPNADTGAPPLRDSFENVQSAADSIKCLHALQLVLMHRVCARGSPLLSSTEYSGKTQYKIFGERPWHAASLGVLDSRCIKRRGGHGSIVTQCKYEMDRLFLRGKDNSAGKGTDCHLPLALQSNAFIRIELLDHCALLIFIVTYILKAPWRDCCWDIYVFRADLATYGIPTTPLLVPQTFMLFGEGGGLPAQVYKKEGDKQPPPPMGWRMVNGAEPKPLMRPAALAWRRDGVPIPDVAQRATRCSIIKRIVHRCSLIKQRLGAQSGGV